MLKHKNLYYIGGVVRDEILGVQSFDTDYCYEGNAIEFAKQQGLNIIKENPEFGTVRVLFEHKEIDIASTRTETYPKKGHLPKVSNIGCNLEEDLKRRDFTINAIAKNTLTGKLVDCFDGLKDIKNKQLRILHKESFIDDPTRILRGLKFSVRFDFELEEETKILQEQYLNNVNYDMSFHRLKKELTETFNLNQPEALEKFKKQKIYKLLAENIEYKNIQGNDIYKTVKTIQTPYLWLIYMAPFINNLTNLSLTKAEKKIVEWSERLKTQEPVNNTPTESIIIRRLIDNV